MQQKETERADDRIDEEFYEELSEEEIQDEIASCTGDGVTWMRDIMQNRPRDTDSGTGSCAGGSEEKTTGRRNKKRMKSLFIKNFYIPLQGIIFLF